MGGGGIRKCEKQKQKNNALMIIKVSIRGVLLFCYVFSDPNPGNLTEVSS